MGALGVGGRILKASINFWSFPLSEREREWERASERERESERERAREREREGFSESTVMCHAQHFCDILIGFTVYVFK